ncbi:hypothetical protein [Clostridium tagluense]|uniref:hypothetical protein n=1 Tax=Clostridium tagluense TaxID=360422 RepID=UPI001C6E1A1B|nr:hypothetical protein [Clostridium tagluense]MBW9157223.1 hypothetical protein [Clostridium tagluense]WLC67176.1 hypothetical protein KTC93_08360 [Clostridium tagluense]
MEKLLDICAELLDGNNYEALVATIVLIVSILLFKEFRKNKLESDSNNSQRTNEAIDLYSRALSTINKFEKDHFDINLLYDDLYTMYKYSPKDVISQIESWISDSNRNTLELTKILKNDMYYLKSLQYDSVSFRLKNEFCGAIEYYYHKHNFSSFVMPIVNTFISILSILVMVLFILTFNPVSISAKVLILVLLISSIMYMFLIMAVFDLIITKKFKYSKLNVLYASILVLSVMPLLIRINLIAVTLYTVYIWVYLIFILKRSIK